MKPCIFCPRPRTSKRGEHVWDDWLNREDGIPLRLRSIVTESGKDGVLIREYPANKLDVTKDVVCDPCNNGWMSELSELAKYTLEGFIRHERAATLLELGILTTAAFAFMKSAVLDYSAEKRRPPYISPAICHRFRTSLQAGPTFWLPDGLQIWVARYKRERKMESLFWIDGLAITKGAFRGFDILLITYVVGAFAFQLTFPRWRKRANRPSLPFIRQPAFWDVGSIPIWPNVGRVTWPPAQQLDRPALKDFRERFRVAHSTRR